MEHKLFVQFNKLKKPQFLTRNVVIISLLWLAAAISDRLWLILDNSVPAWDQSAHLTGALNHWRVLQNPHIFSADWWHQLWQLSPSYRGPFVYLVTTPFFSLFGRGYEQATLVNLFFTAVILICVYHLGKHLFSPKIGLWAAGLCLLMPSMAFVRIDYLLDYGVTSLVIFTFTCLTFWRDALTRRLNWLWSISFGLGLGLILLTKPTGIFFLLVPSIWLLGETLFKRKWERLLPLIVSIVISLVVCSGWYRTNWLTIITSALGANAVGIGEGDPGVNTLAGWLYYFNILPEMVSLPLLLVPLGCFILSFGLWVTGKRGRVTEEKIENHTSKIRWLLGFCLGAYVLCSLGTNKDLRFIMPYLPVIGLLLAYGLNIWSNLWGSYLRWGTVALAGIMLLFNLFPIPGSDKLGGKHLPYLGSSFPHSQVIAEVVKTNPYLRSNIGVIPKYTPQVNPFTLDFYGNLADFRVYGRQLADSREQVFQDGRSLDWYITKTGEKQFSGEIDSVQMALQTSIEQSPEMQLQKTWSLPDGNQLKLYHRRLPAVTVEPLSQSFDEVNLESVTVPAQVPPGKPVPVTYQFSGTWEQLQDGLVLLTWQGEKDFWLHDRAIGLGQLYAGLTPPSATQGFRVVERLAMLPPAQISPGTYTLNAVYLHRKTGKTYNLDLPAVHIIINPTASPQPAPELDLITQLHQLGTSLAKGKLDPVFKDINRLNQYDPLQDYLVQAEQILTYRLNAESKNLELAYPLVLSQVLQRRSLPLLDTLGHITQVDAANPYAWTYLGVIHLYNWQPHKAELAFQTAERLNPNLPELKTLKLVASIMKLNLLQAWERFQAISK